MEDEIRQAKKLARPKLDPEAWGRRRLHEIDLEEFLGCIDDKCERIRFEDVDEDEFRERFEEGGEGGLSKPCIIQGLVDTWAASKFWSVEQLAERFGEEHFKCGETEEGEEIEVSLQAFAQYIGSQTDDVPLYVFDESWAEEGRNTACLLDEYKPPPYFVEDLFKYLGEDKRPPYRWILLGPQRSGSRIHIDPCGTSAWNSLISGKKRWVLFPPGTPRNIVKPDAWMNAGVEGGEAIDWFMHHFKGMSERLPAHQHPIVCDMVAGDTIFVPGGWYHTVLNMTDTVAVTHNFVSTSCFMTVWREFQATRSKLSRQWVRALEVDRPDLVELTQGGDKGGKKKEKNGSRAKQNKLMRNGIAAVKVKGKELCLQRAVRIWKEYKYQESDDEALEGLVQPPAQTQNALVTDSNLALQGSLEEGIASLQLKAVEGTSSATSTTSWKKTNTHTNKKIVAKRPLPLSMLKKTKPHDSNAVKKVVTWAASVQGGEEEIDWDALREGDFDIDEDIEPLKEVV